jgi:hypothetical protein
MKIMIAGLVLAGAAVGGLLLGADGGGATSAPEEKDVAKNPAALILPSTKVDDVSVYGVKLGDSVDKIPGNVGVTQVGVPDRPQDAIYTGRNVSYYACDGKIYRIKVLGDIAKQLPTYDAARLQMALGKADETAESRNGEDTRLTYFGRRLQYTVHAFRALSVVTEVDLYAR